MPGTTSRRMRSLARVALMALLIAGGAGAASVARGLLPATPLPPTHATGAIHRRGHPESHAGALAAWRASCTATRLITGGTQIMEAQEQLAASFPIREPQVSV